MTRKILIRAVIILTVLCIAVTGYYYRRYSWSVKNDPAKWEEDIQVIEGRTKIFPSHAKAVVFIGSSTIRRWGTLQEDMAPIPVLNHGFGGSRIQDSTYYAERLIVAYDPAAVILYAGDNDIYFSDLFSKKTYTVQRCFEDFVAFISAVHSKLPQLKIYYVSIKPSPAREKNWERMQEANALIKEYCSRDERLEYIDIAGPMLSNGGKPDNAHFADDGLHLSRKGYQLWTEIIKPHILKYRSLQI